MHVGKTNQPPLPRGNGAPPGPGGQEAAPHPQEGRATFSSRGPSYFFTICLAGALRGLGGSRGFWVRTRLGAQGLHRQALGEGQQAAGVRGQHDGTTPGAPGALPGPRDQPHCSGTPTPTQPCYSHSQPVPCGAPGLAAQAQPLPLCTPPQRARCPLTPPVAPATPSGVIPDLSTFLCTSQITYFPRPPLRGENHKPPFVGVDAMPPRSAVGKGGLGSGGERAVRPLPHAPVHVSCSSGIPGSASSPPAGLLRGPPPLPFSPAGSLNPPSRWGPIPWGPIPWHTFSITQAPSQRLRDHTVHGVPAPPTAAWTAGPSKPCVPVPTQPTRGQGPNA